MVGRSTGVLDLSFACEETPGAHFLVRRGAGCAGCARARSFALPAPPRRHCKHQTGSLQGSAQRPGRGSQERPVSGAYATVFGVARASVAPTPAGGGARGLRATGRWGLESGGARPDRLTVLTRFLSRAQSAVLTRFLSRAQSALRGKWKGSPEVDRRATRGGVSNRASLDRPRTRGGHTVLRAFAAQMFTVDRRLASQSNARSLGGLS